MTWISIGKVTEFFGVTTQSICDWTKQGRLEAIRRLGRHRRYNLEGIEKKLGIENENEKTILYSRVSAHNQKEDLVRVNLATASTNNLLFSAVLIGERVNFLLFAFLITKVTTFAAILC
ncbi:hypothetical protein [Candidatus Uabimicrobium sp. HlEnr_7]|uniref:hypothetical protein n=1 Tax=Candidatus Uabimicrobium helgolandensis TaxID=3095367 RepID=UPI0035563EEC